MASTQNPKSVFVGNVPFSITEEQLKDLLGQAGPVVRLRMLVNPDTGKPRGYGFADFIDADSAAAAVRNLNGLDIQGRKIRVDWPTGTHGEKEGGQGLPEAHPEPAPVPPPNALPPLPPGVDLPPNLKVSDSISSTLAALPPAQLLDALTQMKAMAISEPAKANELLTQAPQLSYAIFQALILMNLVDPSVLAQVVQQAASQPQPQQQQPTPAPPQPQPTPQQYPGYPPPPQGMPGQQMPGMPPRPPQPQYPPQQMQQQPPPQQQQQPPPQPPQLSQEQLQQLLQLPPQVIDTLPPDQRAQIMSIRAQYGVR